MELKSGHKCIPLKEEELEEHKEFYSHSKEGVIRLYPGGWVLPATIGKYAKKICEFKFQPSDVLILTYPKCGTTWMQEIVWTMRNNINFDHPDAMQMASYRAPFIEGDIFLDLLELEDPPYPDEATVKFFNKHCPGKDPLDGIYLQLAENIPGPRTMKSHLPFSFFTPDLLDICKVIFVARNPKDVCVSYFHHHKLFKAQEFFGNFDQYVGHFVKGTNIYSPFWEYMREAWQRRNNHNLLFCYFEEMKANPRKNIEKINKFIGTGLNNEEIDKVLDYTSFDTMKKQGLQIGTSANVPSYINEEHVKKEGGFFREGEAGSWKAKLSLEQEHKITIWSKKNLQKGFDSNFLYWDWF